MMKVSDPFIDYYDEKIGQLKHGENKKKMHTFSMNWINTFYF